MNPDVIIIGTGQAGVPLATRLAAAGKRVLIAERSLTGGTCANYGCTPTKTMIASARAAHVARTAGRLGVRVDGVRIDFAAVVQRKDEVVQRWRSGVLRRLENAGPNVILAKGHARFVGEREVELDGQRHRAPTVVINTGARPSVAKIRGLDAVPWLDNHRVMELRELPTHLVVVGGGYVGCEFAQMFRRLGSDVTGRESLVSPPRPRRRRSVERRRGGFSHGRDRAPPRSARSRRRQNPRRDPGHALDRTRDPGLAPSRRDRARAEHGRPRMRRRRDRTRPQRLRHRSATTTRPRATACTLVGDAIAQPRSSCMHTSWDDLTGCSSITLVRR